MKRIEAIRNHKLVGRGSCSSIDECYTDAELTKALDADKVAPDDVEGAIKWALDFEGMFLEKGLNQRWGEDDDGQLKEYMEFNKARR